MKEYCYKSIDNAVVDTALLSELTINNAKKYEASVRSGVYKQNKLGLLWDNKFILKSHNTANNSQVTSMFSYIPELLLKQSVINYTKISDSETWTLVLNTAWIKATYDPRTASDVTN